MTLSETSCPHCKQTVKFQTGASMIVCTSCNSMFQNPSIAGYAETAKFIKDEIKNGKDDLDRRMA